MGVIGGGVFQAIKGFRNAPVVSLGLPREVQLSRPCLQDTALKTPWTCQSHAQAFWCLIAYYVSGLASGSRVLGELQIQLVVTPPLHPSGGPLWNFCAIKMAITKS